MKDFKKLVIWKKGLDIAVACYSFTKDLPGSEKFGLVSQMNRAAVSIPLNIAEGNSRSSDKDNKRFMEIALGSCNELETLFILAEKLDYSSNQTISGPLLLIREEQKLLWSFIQKLKTTPS